MWVSAAITVLFVILGELLRPDVHETVDFTPEQLAYGAKLSLAMRKHYTSPSRDYRTARATFFRKSRKCR